MNQRWRISLHEAGHAIYGQLKMGDTSGHAVVLENLSGAYAFENEIPIVTFDRAILAACGPAAEELAGQFEPPKESPKPKKAVCPGPSEVSAFKEIQKSIRGTVTQGFSDDEIVAKWCVLGCPSSPERWVRRHRIVTETAKMFVSFHAEQILCVARELYLTGVYFFIERK
jgi:hypothetical protein